MLTSSTLISFGSACFEFEKAHKFQTNGYDQLSYDQQLAMEFYHQNESPLIQALGCITEQEWNAAFQAVLRKPLSYFLEHIKEIFNVLFDKK